MPPLLGPLANPSAHLSELAKLISMSPEWESVKTAMLASWTAHGDKDKVAEVGRRALHEAGFGGSDVLASMPEAYRQVVPDADMERATEAIELYMLASVINDIVNGEPLPIMAPAGGSVTVEHIVKDGIELPVVHAHATPLGDPVQIAEKFLSACYRAFGSDTFARHGQGSRDAEWFARNNAGETCREIALSDPRSGLAPEAAVSPDEYADEVKTATVRVVKACQRFRERWTRFADSMSTD